LFNEIVINVESWWDDVAYGDVPGHGSDFVYCVVKSVSVVDSVKMDCLDFVRLVVSENHFEVVVTFGGNDNTLHFDVAGEFDACESDALVSSVGGHVQTGVFQQIVHIDVLH
jgi:hypothetical protein